MRLRDIDRSGPVWWYRIAPSEVAREESNGCRANLHKTALHDDGSGHAVVKRLPIGPGAQAILHPFLEARGPVAYIFYPGEAKAFFGTRNAARIGRRGCGHRTRQTKKRSARSDRRGLRVTTKTATATLMPSPGPANRPACCLGMRTSSTTILGCCYESIMVLKPPRSSLAILHSRFLNSTRRPIFPKSSALHER